MNKKTASFLALGLLLAASLACNLGKSAPTENTPGESNSNQLNNAPEVSANSAPASACDNVYYPTKAGNRWVYQMTGSAADTFTRTILANNGTSFTDQDTFSAGTIRTGEWKCENGNLIALTPGGGQSAAVTANNVTSSFQTTFLEGISIPAVINPGDTWTQKITIEGVVEAGGLSNSVRNEAVFTCNAIGTETVTVQAGTFETVKLECVTTMNISMLNDGSATPLTSVTMNSTTWYAPKTGWVKSINTGSDLDSTIELVSYNVQ